MTKLKLTSSELEAYYASPRRVKRWDITSNKPTKPPTDMKVLAFNASPRKRGNTDVLIDEALRGAKDAGAASIEKIILHKMKIRYCVGCHKCHQPGWDGFCAQKDDMADIYPKIADADAIIVGFPIHIGRESAQLATFFDRWWCISKEKIGTGKRGMVIGTWGHPPVDVFDSVIERIMLTLSWKSIGIETVEALSASGFMGKLNGFDENGKAIILRFPDELKKAYEAGKTLVTG